MAHSQHLSVPNQVQDDLELSERSLMANSIAKGRQVSKDSIQRLEHIIADQQDRLVKMRHQSAGSSSHTLRLRASIKDSLVTYKLTLQTIKQSAETLELTWANLVYECSTADA